MIDTKVANFGTNVNGWLVNAQPGVYGAEYLFRAAVTQFGLGANIAQEALYPATFTDIKGRPLNGTNNYVIHFNPGQTPPLDGFWSISMYNDKSLFVDNPINRYAIWQYTKLDLAPCYIRICQKNRFVIEHGPYPTVQRTGE